MFENSLALRLMILSAMREGLRTGTREVSQQLYQDEEERLQEQARSQQEERRAIAAEVNPGWVPGQP
jgi:hypothetical protein